MHPDLQGDGVPGATQLHPPGPGGAELPGGLGERRQGGGLWAGAVRARRPVHVVGRHQVPHKVGAARGAQLHAILVQVGYLGVRGAHVGSVYMRENAIWSIEKYRSC